ncbi:FP [Choristoneura occidentalis granulovirus]|uniref:FP n=1 Tax=Choristoneura occidentalis granulovirus TaxID=364745 RepID=Q1A4J9_9BBAC|nr:FP [Choristoneura fumiferana granulovirus]ABC61231.1 FP [Choristoneura fumiferana granulovirus]
MQQKQHASQIEIDNCVEVFGLGHWDDYDECLHKICNVLNLNFLDVETYTIKKNGLLVKLVNERAVNEWERKSREKRIHLYDIDKNGEYNKIKIFAAAPTKFKLLLHTVRKTLPNFKYIWIGKRGVMARQKSRTHIHVIKTDQDINYLKSCYALESV